MNMIQGVFQRLFVVEMSDSHLLIRELPLLDWLLAFLFLLAGLIFWFASILITAAIGLAIAVVLVMQSRVRLISFSTEPNLMQVIYRGVFRSELINELSLHEISRATLKKDDDGGSQIVLIMSDGEELGLSVYSKDMRDWKEGIVIAINAILHNAHKDDPNREMMV